MNPAKATALLNGRVQGFTLGLGGEHLSDADMAHAIGKLWHEGARLYGRVKFAGQDVYFDELLEYFMRDMKALKSLDGWSDATPGELKCIAKLALVESLFPKQCPTCKGIGSLMIEKQKRGRPSKKAIAPTLKIVCDDCAGEGIRPHTEFMLAKTAQISRRRWTNVWSYRYHHQVTPLVDRYEQLFWRGIRRALRE